MDLIPHKPTSHTSTSSEHHFTPQSNAREPQRLLTFHEAVSKSRTRIQTLPPPVP